MGQPISSTLAMIACAYLNPMSKIGEDKLDKITSMLERFISKTPSKRFR